MLLNFYQVYSISHWWAWTPGSKLLLEKAHGGAWLLVKISCIAFRSACVWKKTFRLVHGMKTPEHSQSPVSPSAWLSCQGS